MYEASFYGNIEKIAFWSIQMEMKWKEAYVFDGQHRNET